MFKFKSIINIYTIVNWNNLPTGTDVVVRASVSMAIL